MLKMTKHNLFKEKDQQMSINKQEWSGKEICKWSLFVC